MALSRRQRNIVNPYADEFYEDFAYQGGYDSDRNSWVIEGIHQIYLNFGEFPLNNQEILARGSLPENTSITTDDLRAYGCTLSSECSTRSRGGWCFSTPRALPKQNRNKR